MLSPVRSATFTLVGRRITKEKAINDIKNNAKKIKSDDSIGRDREKSNIAIAIY